MLSKFVSFLRSHDYEQFAEMMHFVVPGSGESYIKEKHLDFVNRTSYFLMNLTEESLERLENWLLCYEQADSCKNLNRLLNEQFELEDKRC